MDCGSLLLKRMGYCITGTCATSMPLLRSGVRDLCVKASMRDAVIRKTQDERSKIMNSRAFSCGERLVVVHPVGSLALAFDHRANDGAYASAFLAKLKEIIETRDWSTEL